MSLISPQTKTNLESSTNSPIETQLVGTPMNPKINLNLEEDPQSRGSEERD